MHYLVGIVAVVFAAVLFFPKRKVSGARIAAGLPLIGNLLDMLPDVIVNAMDRYSRKYGKVFEVSVFFKRMLVISDLSMAKEILTKRPKGFRRARSLDNAAVETDVILGLFHSSGNVWKRVQHFTATSFAKHNVTKNNLKIFDQSRVLSSKIKSKADGKSVINVKDEMFYFTLAVICEVAFGLKLTGEYKEYFHGSQFRKDIHATFTYYIENMLFPFPQWVWNLIPYCKHMENVAKEGDARFTKYYLEIIANRRELYEKSKTGLINPKELTSMIDCLIRYETAETAEGSRDVTDKEILANVKTFFLAGSDTTSVLLTWMLYHLSLHPAYLAAAREEADPCYRAIREAEEKGALTNELLDEVASVDRLRFMFAVLKESLRLTGPAPFLANELEDTARDHSYTTANGITIRPGDEVLVYVDGLCWDEEVFEDARTFNPWRWLKSTPEKLQRMEECMLVFGFGPRICPGMGLSNKEALYALLAIVCDFDFQLACPKEEIQRVLMFTAQPNKMPMVFTSRRIV